MTMIRPIIEKVMARFDFCISSGLSPWVMILKADKKNIDKKSNAAPIVINGRMRLSKRAMLVNFAGLKILGSLRLIA